MAKKTYQHICKYCGKLFESTYKQQKYCYPTCRTKFRNVKKKIAYTTENSIVFKSKL